MKSRVMWWSGSMACVLVLGAGCSLLGVADDEVSEPISTAQPAVEAPADTTDEEPTRLGASAPPTMALPLEDTDPFAFGTPRSRRAPKKPPGPECHAMPGGSVTVDVATDGGYQLYQKVSEKRGTPELHVFSVYETSSDHGGGRHPEGSATVRVDRAGEQALVLVSYEPVHWEVLAGEETTLNSVTVYGYHGQRVSAPKGVEVEIFSYEQGTDKKEYCGYSIPYNGGGCDTDVLLTQIERDAGRPITTFHGTYRARIFEIRDTGCDEK